MSFHKIAPFSSFLKNVSNRKQSKKEEKLSFGQIFKGQLKE